MNAAVPRLTHLAVLVGILFYVAVGEAAATTSALPRAPTATTSVVGNTSSQVVLEPTPLSPLNESALYHGAPSLVSIYIGGNGSGSTPRSITLAVWEGSPTGATPGLDNQRIYFSSSNDNGARWAFPTAVPSYSGTAAMWSPALYYDATTGTLYLYYSVDRMIRGGTLFVTSSPDLGATWAYHEEVTGVEGYISGPIAALTSAASTFQNKPTWAFVVENPGIGSFVVRALLGSTAYAVSVVIVPKQFTSAMLVLLSSSDDAFLMGIVAAVNPATYPTAFLGDEATMPLVFASTTDATLTSGWTGLANLTVVTPLGRSFFAASPLDSMDTLRTGGAMAVATFPTNVSSELVVVGVDVNTLNAIESGSLPINTTYSTIKDPSWMTGGVYINPVANLSDNATTIAANGRSFYLVAFASGYQLMTCGIAVRFPFSVPSGAPGAPSSGTAIAITFITIGAVAAMLVVVFVQGRIREKRRMQEESALLRPPASDAVVAVNQQYGGSGSDVDQQPQQL